MITMGQRWMAKLLMWVSGQKHPDTPKMIYKNVWEYDRIRKILKRRCVVCDYVTSADEKNLREITVVCGKPGCNCRTWGARPHEVCHACFDMWEALYANEELQKKNKGDYFQKIDEQEAREKEERRRGDNRRDKLGL